MLLSRAKDPFLQGVTITDVQVSPDLAVANVFYTAPEKALEQTSNALQRATPFLRRQLGAQLHLKRTPEIRFEYDESLDQGMHIDSLLRELSEGEAGEEP